MTMKRKFYLNQLKRLLPLTGVVLALCLIFHYIEISLNSYAIPQHGYFMVRNVSPGIAFLTYLAASYALILPIHLFSYRFSREKEDLLYALPIRKRALAFLTYLVGLTSVCIVFSIPYLLGILMRLFQPHSGLCFGNFFSYLPIALLLLTLVFSMGSVFSLVSRGVLENVFVLLFSQLFFLMVSLIVAEMSKGSFLCFVPLTGISYVTLIFDTLIGHSYQGVKAMPAPVDGPVMDLGIRPANFDDPTFLGAFVFLVLLATLIVPVLLFLVERQKSEDTGRPSRSWLGLRSVLPATDIAVLSCFGAIAGHELSYGQRFDWTWVVIGVLLCSLAYLLLDMLRRRKLSFTLESLLFLGGGLCSFGIFTPISREIWLLLLAS